ncbi:MAG: prepilin-type N-terminal cleavage/methylation domain-containing protein [Desulfotignum sp.]|nr:prepilin-type N-terminal cleavage/methylation domain-containing protein [Desulfotignum sp.]MCF8113571.1 prepilin-type N-terminal cleavage/methylation domain-containing protein [Desulfotignum sp.]MCF8124875.1 prepilin-type N-terminal cleavage/methylation domain-containing protein [Desulfotignum sp.]
MLGQPKRYKKKDPDGFSLLEVMIALAVLAIGILAILSMHISAIKGNANAVKFTDDLLSTQSSIESMLINEEDDSIEKIRSSLESFKNRK